MIADIYDKLSTLGMTPDGLYAAFERASENFSGELIVPSLLLLSACLAIRILVGTIKEVIDGNLVDVISNVVFAGLMGIILSALILWWNDGAFSVRGFSEQTYRVMFGIVTGEGQSMDTIAHAVITPATHAIEVIFTQLTGLSGRILMLPEVPENPLWGMVALLSHIVSIIFSIIFLFVASIMAFLASASIIALMLVVLFFMLAGLIAMQVGLAFGPIAVAAYPLIDTWAKKVVGVIAGGIAQATAGLLLITVVTALILNLGDALPIVSTMGFSPNPPAP